MQLIENLRFQKLANLIEKLRFQNLASYFEWDNI
jgi:hypothetical protein